MIKSEGDQNIKTVTSDSSPYSSSFSFLNKCLLHIRILILLFSNIYKFKKCFSLANRSR